MLRKASEFRPSWREKNAHVMIQYLCIGFVKHTFIPFTAKQWQNISHFMLLQVKPVASYIRRANCTKTCSAVPKQNPSLPESVGAEITGIKQADVGCGDSLNDTLRQIVHFNL